MRLILREDIEKLGKRGDIVKVAAGYARNYLLPKKLAMEINDNNVRQIEKEKKVIATTLAKEKEEAEALAVRVAEIKLSFRRKVHGEELYGSVSAADLADALEQKGLPIEKRKILLDEPIKMLGEFPVSIKLHPEVTTSFLVIVEKEED